MIILAFSRKTSKKIPQIICRKYKHVAPIVPNGKVLVLYQFIRPGHIEKITLYARDLKILNANGWDFVYIDGISIPHDFNVNNAITCVDLSKRIIKMKNAFVQTPWGLYKKIKKQYP